MNSNSDSVPHIRGNCISQTSSLSSRLLALFVGFLFLLALAAPFAFEQFANAASTQEKDDSGIQPGITRLASDDSAGTSLDIAKQAYDKSDWVIISRDDDFADAMSATGLAGALDAPIILANRETGLSEDALAQIQAIGAKNAYIIGGFGAIPTIGVGDFEG